MQIQLKIYSLHLNKGYKMKIILTPQESEEYFYNALCNGLMYINQYGIEVIVDEKAYKKAKNTLKKNNKDCCYEDVLMEVLKQGDKLNFCETEEMKDNYITLSMVHDRVAKTPLQHLTNMINEEDDAETADCIIQSVLFDGEIVYG